VGFGDRGVLRDGGCRCSRCRFRLADRLPGIREGRASSMEGCIVESSDGEGSFVRVRWGVTLSLAM
jgi:hypothetical protein